MGDRIAIMSEGLVKCCGSPMFLKKAFSAGYQLRLQKNDRFDRNRALQQIRSVMSEAEIKSEIHSEVIVSLEGQDRAEDSTKRLCMLFQLLETSKQLLGIESCGLTVTTMEDVFLRVGTEYSDDPQELLSNGQRNGSTERLFQTIPKNTGTKLFFQQLWALLLKRFHFARRYWPMMTMQIVLPALLFMATMLIDWSMKKAGSDTDVDRELNMNQYGNTIGFFKYENEDRFRDIYNKTSAAESVQTFALNYNGKTFKKLIFKFKQFLFVENPAEWTINRGGDNLKSFIHTYLVGAQIESNSSGLQLMPWYNREASHSTPASINILYQSVIKIMFPDASISVSNHPVPGSGYSNSFDMAQISLMVTCLVMVPLTVPFLGASYVLFPVHERVSNSKLLQLMNGISSVTFWAASFIFDLITHLAATCIIFIIFAIFDFNKVFLGTDNTRTGLFFMVFLFGFASIPLAYLTSLKMKKPSTGYALLVIIYLISGLVLVMTVEFMVLGGTLKGDGAKVLRGFVRLLPVYSMSLGIEKLYKVGSFNAVCNQMNPILLSYRCSKLTPSDHGKEIYGCCKSLCEPKNECYYQMNPLSWSDHGKA